MNITLVRAVFAVAVAIGGECLPADGADIAVNRLLFDHLRVSVPPHLSALVGAEPSGFLFLYLDQLFPTLGAVISLFYLLCRPDTSHTIPTTE